MQEFLSEPVAQSTTGELPYQRDYDYRVHNIHLQTPTEYNQYFSNDHREYCTHTSDIQNEINMDEINDYYPKIRASQRSERLLRKSIHFEPNFQARLEYYTRRSQHNREQIRSEIDTKVENQMKQAPSINRVCTQTS